MKKETDKLEDVISTASWKIITPEYLMASLLCIRYKSIFKGHVSSTLHRL